jgi:F0F1-type ATP synthase gamma subunit
MWKDNFSGDYGTTDNVKRLNKEIKDAVDKKRSQAKINKALTDVIKGKVARRGF